jgi:hypothetical protein
MILKYLKSIVLVSLFLALASPALIAQNRRGSRNNRVQLVSRLTGTYRVDRRRSNDGHAAAEQATRNLPERNRQRALDNLLARLDSPASIAIQQTGRTTISLASSSAPQVTFEADGQDRTETTDRGRTLTTRATLTGDRLEINSSGDRSLDYNVAFVSQNNGQRLMVTRRIYGERLNQPVEVVSYYDKDSNIARWDVYNGQATNTTYGTDNGNSGTELGTANIPDGTRFVAVLNNDLSTNGSQDRAPFSATVREPSQYSSAVITGYVTGIERSGRVTGRSQMTLNFENIRLRNGQSYRFSGLVESVESVESNGKTIRVDNEGTAQGSNQTQTTGVRAAIGTGIGAIIGAIVGGGKGAAIGGGVGAGAGVGSVYVQGSDDLELSSGSELTIRATAPVLTR